ncbi:DUF3265 domain-containing protein [Vibrio parahaemolyticus]|nr:DUF3265 domain-containing protein [Vibrio parahaemolyticus]EHH1935255.1 DUF3265 domain-containing protein [Vibrio parahaemolyticus]EIZ1043117.1 DUF3265 domain-containing protein [Vibrio parahaemolyticus]ELA9373159.1 DUF3265 domain-containing protein [Vibrio parahaemolyticus]TOA49016.1 DUF3265 domain-containing protein [Vibrio parahaemolyticus]
MQLIAGSTISHLYVQCIKILTICLRAIRNAWHFCYALRFVFKVACVSFGIQLLTP